MVRLVFEWRIQDVIENKENIIFSRLGSIRIHRVLSPGFESQYFSIQTFYRLKNRPTYKPVCKCVSLHLAVYFGINATISIFASPPMERP